MARSDGSSARRIIHQREPRPIWVLLRRWQPSETDPAERLRLLVARYAFNHRVEDYRDEALALHDLYQEATRLGLDWKTLQAEYNAMCAE